MFHKCSQIKIPVIQIGKLDVTQVYRVLIIANKIQKSFNFDFVQDYKIAVDDSYKLPNGTIDLCTCSKNNFKLNVFNKFEKPLILLSDDPMGDPEKPHEPEDYYFYSREDDYDSRITIISNYPLKYLPPNRSLENYLLMMLATYIFSNFVDLPFHEETKGCFMDYCNDITDAEKALINGSLCDDCLNEIQNGLRQKEVKTEIVAAAYKLLYKAINKKYCFVAMPLNEGFTEVYRAIKDSFDSKNWVVANADEIAYPRLITEKIYQEILSSNLVIADITNDNPNVFYEVGLTHAIGNDLLLITQNKSIPFDLKNEKTIFYSPELLDDLKKLINKTVYKNIVRDNAQTILS